VADSSNNGHSANLFDAAKNARWSQQSEKGQGRKRGRNAGDQSEANEEEEALSAPANDIYRKRQQKRMK